jgi:hypothetical protein
MSVYRVVGIALVLAWPLLSAQGCAQGVWPVDRSTTGVREERLLDETRAVGRDNPASGYDVSTGIQQRAIEKALPR